MMQQQGFSSSSSAGVRGGGIDTGWGAETGAAQGAVGQTAGSDSAWAPNPRSGGMLPQGVTCKLNYCSIEVDDFVSPDPQFLACAAGVAALDQHCC
jgi:hypothetical protein